MFLIEGLQAAFPSADQDAVDAIIERLAEAGRRPVLRSLSTLAGDVVCAAPSAIHVTELFRRGESLYSLTLGTPPIGDAFFAEDVVHLLQPVGSRLQAWEVRRHTSPSSIEPFCDSIGEAHRAGSSEGLELSWSPIDDGNVGSTALISSWLQLPDRQREPVELSTKPADYSDADVARTLLLVQREQRTFLLRLAQSGGKARALDLSKNGNQSMAEELIQSGLVRKEYLLLCRQDSHTISSFAERTELEGAAGKDFSCPVCGRPFLDELVQDILALTDDARKLLNGSRWMSIWVTSILVQAGLRRDQIAWNVVAGEDELDIMCEIGGKRAFLELKDREFGLGDAYPFGFRVPRYGGSYGVVVCTERIATEAKKFLEDLKDCKMSFLEGEEEISALMAELVGVWSRDKVASLVNRLFQGTSFDMMRAIGLWMDKHESEVRSVANR